MADLAIGANCSACGTLVACAGSYSDERLVGACPVCKIAVGVANPNYVSPAPYQPEPAVSEPVPFEPEPEPEPQVPVDNPIIDEVPDAEFE